MLKRRDYSPEAFVGTAPAGKPPHRSFIPPRRADDPIGYFGYELLADDYAENDTPNWQKDASLRAEHSQLLTTVLPFLHRELNGTSQVQRGWKPDPRLQPALVHFLGALEFDQDKEKPVADLNAAVFRKEFVSGLALAFPKDEIDLLQLAKLAHRLQGKAKDTLSQPLTVFVAALRETADLIRGNLVIKEHTPKKVLAMGKTAPTTTTKEQSA